MRSIIFDGSTWPDYEKLRQRDKILYRNLCRILQEMQCSDPKTSLGKPEPLKHQLSGLWSRRLSKKDRLVYRFDDDSIHTFAIGGHYEFLM